MTKTKKFLGREVFDNSHRNVITEYFRGRTLIHINRAKYVNSAVVRTFDHMQMNHYGATAATVYDANTSILHAVLTLSASGDLKVAYKRAVAEVYK
jgi:hypothetical protein